MGWRIEQHINQERLHVGTFAYSKFPPLTEYNHFLSLIILQRPQRKMIVRRAGADHDISSLCNCVFYRIDFYRNTAVSSASKSNLGGTLFICLRSIGGSLATLSFPCLYSNESSRLFRNRPLPVDLFYAWNSSGLLLAIHH